MFEKIVRKSLTENLNLKFKKIAQITSVNFQFTIQTNFHPMKEKIKLFKSLKPST